MNFGKLVINLQLISIFNQTYFKMNGIAALNQGRSHREATYETPSCTVMEFISEGLLCVSQGGFNNLGHNGFVGEDFSGGWDNN